MHGMPLLEMEGNRIAMIRPLNTLASVSVASISWSHKTYFANKPPSTAAEITRRSLFIGDTSKP